MTRSHRFRSTTLPRVALVVAAFLMAGLSAPPAAAQTAAQVVPPGEPQASATTYSSAPVRRGLDILERSEQQRAAEAARVEAVRVQRYLAAVAVLEAERASQVAAQQALERAVAERAEAERVEAERSATRQASTSLPGGFAALRNCESGGNYGAVNSSGTYRGAYQFSRTTWNSVAASSFPHLVGVDPAAAAPGDQDAMAKALYNRSGAGQWPHCGRHL